MLLEGKQSVSELLALRFSEYFDVRHTKLFNNMFIHMYMYMCIKISSRTFSLTVYATDQYSTVLN